MTFNCPICGKFTVAHWPEFWVYRMGDTMFCSENCYCVELFRETRSKDKVNFVKRRHYIMSHKIITDEVKQEAYRIALEGGDPRPYLRSVGTKCPNDTWQRIRKELKDEDPETYERLPKRIPFNKKNAAKPETPEQLPAVKLTGPVRIETPEGKKLMDIDVPEAPKAVLKPGKPLTYEGNKVCCVRNDYGQFFWDCDHNRLDWTTAEGEEVSFTPQGWNAFLNEVFPTVCKILGVPV